MRWAALAAAVAALMLLAAGPAAADEHNHRVRRTERSRVDRHTKRLTNGLRACRISFPQRPAIDCRRIALPLGTLSPPLLIVARRRSKFCISQPGLPVALVQYQVGDTVTLWVNKVGPYNNPQETCESRVNAGCTSLPA